MSQDPQVSATVAGAARAGDAARVLHEVFGHAAFRGDQRRVCEAVIGGRDALLVMPTGAGKSLCFQLPAVVRGGTCLVISPLLALIEDQVAKLNALGLRAERIHSGIDRERSREICRQYLRGELNYLYIAPERLRVPGFLEFLAKRTPSLVAVDEAHCISHWGHDFRPEYRMLGERLPALRPAPVIALTATATADVQEDIVRQLGLDEAEICISGFRRTNLAVRCESLLPSLRPERVLSIISESGRLPAVVYAPTRREVENLAGYLNSKKVRAVAYHAGMSAAERERAQDAFLRGATDIIVATVAFGMGIDKANVRTVVHAGLPGSLEGYYQEIGRAGRDGLPSDVTLLHSHADRRTQEYLLSKSYPDPAIVKKVYLALSSSPRTAEDLAERLQEEPDVVARSIEQLWVQGGAVPHTGDDPSYGQPDAPSYVRGDAAALPRYTEQRARRHDMLSRMLSFVRTDACRMLDLVGFFGDTGDSGVACGLCDRCRAPARSDDEISAEELRLRAAVARALSGRSQTMGQLARALESTTDRDTLVHVLEGMRHAGMIALENGSFEKDGRRVSFERVRLVGASEMPSKPRVLRSSGRATNHLEAGLRDWRRRTAAEAGIPAFRILTDRTLAAIVERMPEGDEELLDCTGVGPMFVSRYGREVLNILRGGESA